jgi:hypothetical protein
MSFPNEINSPPQAQWWVRVNEGLGSIAASAMYAQNDLTTTLLALGYFGGHIASSVIADSTVALTDASTNYVVAHRTTGAVTAATNTTNWDATGTYGRLFKATTAGGVITALEDWREQSGGWFDRAAAGGALLAANNLSDLGSLSTATATLQSTGLVDASVGFRNVPANSQSAAYTTVAADSGKSIDHPSTDANARTFTIDSNANVAYPVGTCITFTNMTANVVTIAITSDTMYLAGTGATGSRSLAQYGVATARKLTSTTWLISGTGLT